MAESAVDLSALLLLNSPTLDLPCLRLILIFYVDLFWLMACVLCYFDRDFFGWICCSIVDLFNEDAIATVLCNQCEFHLSEIFEFLTMCCCGFAEYLVASAVSYGNCVDVIQFSWKLRDKGFHGSCIRKICEHGSD